MDRPLDGIGILRAGASRATRSASELLALLGADILDAPGSADSLDPRPGVAGALVDAAPRTASPVPFPVEPAGAEVPAAVGWARSGAMAITGDPEGPPLVPRGDHAARLAGAGAALRLLAAIWGSPVGIDGAALVGERAALRGLGRRGTTSANGASRLLPTRDGVVAVTLARPSDRAAVPAWLGIDARAGWERIAATLAALPADEAVARAQLLEIPAAVVPEGDAGIADVQAVARSQAGRPAPFLLDGRRPDRAARTTGSDRRAARRLAGRPPPLVVDLAGLWAGPLTASLLGMAGCRVVKVETSGRPDGARRGPPRFYDLLNGGKESVEVDLASVDGRRLLHRLLCTADVVVEASRPRALEQLGVDPAEARAAHPEQVWVSITGYGRTGPWRNRVAFGDDAAVAGGAVALPGGPDPSPRFCADAYADPVAGLLGAVAALAGLVGGRGTHVDLAMREAVASLGGGPPAAARCVEGDRGWEVFSDGRCEPVAAPRAREPRGQARPLGADTARIAAEVGAA